jgi:hypothetical protein
MALSMAAVQNSRRFIFLLLRGLGCEKAPEEVIRSCIQSGFSTLKTKY